MKRKNNDFDRIIREKLESLETPFQPEGWELFEQRLDAEEAGMPILEETDIDTIAFDKLHQVKVPYDPNHWQLMANRLDHIYGFRRKIATYKLMELVLMLLVLLTLAQLLPETSIVPSATPENLPQQADTPPNKIGPQALERSLLPDPDGSAISQQNERPAIAATQSSIDKKEATNEGNHLTSGLENEERTLATIPPLKGKPSLPAGLTPISILNTTAPVKLMPQTLGAQEASRFRDVIEKDIRLENKKAKFGALASIATLSFNHLDFPGEYGLGVAETQVSKPFSIRIGMLGGMGYDRIITPPTVIDGQEVSADRLAGGYTGGLSIGVERGRWEVETGFMYEAKSYDPPKPVIYVDGSVREGLDVQGVRSYGIDILNIPLWVKYNFVSRDRWRIYAMGGASGHFVMQSSYFLGNEDSFRTANFRPAPATAGSSRSSDLDEKLAKENRALVKGLLEGGRVSENTFFSVNLGFGVERYMTYRWSVFTQPVYQHSFLNLNGGLGPYQDRIHNLSILMGVKVKL